MNVTHVSWTATQLIRQAMDLPERSQVWVNGVSYLHGPVNLDGFNDVGEQQMGAVVTGTYRTPGGTERRYTLRLETEPLTGPQTHGR